MRNQVINYLEGNSTYSVGVSLFLALTKNPNLIRLFSRCYTAEREEKLKYELEKLLPTLPEEKKEEIIFVPGKVSETIVLPNAIAQESEPKQQVERKIFSDNQKDLYRLRGHLHALLHAAKDNLERKDLALQIIQTQKKINKEFKPESNEKKPELSLEQYTRIKNLKMYIARDTRELQKGTSIEKKEKLEQKIKQNKKELEQYAN